MELTGQQVVCEYCGGVIRSEFYDWQTERFEVYERIGTNLRRALPFDRGYGNRVCLRNFCACI